VARDAPPASASARRLSGGQNVHRSSPSGRVRPWRLHKAGEEEQPVPCRPRLVLSDPEAMAQAARQGLGVALLPMVFAFVHLRSGELVRVLPGWYKDIGPLSLYDPSRKLLPAKTRVFVDFVVERFRAAGFARLVDGR
jgi:DNA-binding transcriptional LysR family regulator